MTTKKGTRCQQGLDTGSESLQREGEQYYEQSMPVESNECKDFSTLKLQGDVINFVRNLQGVSRFSDIVMGNWTGNADHWFAALPTT